jgi:hypothetical protein
MKYTYQAIRSQQADSEKKLILFSASASEINMWSGIPQKKRFGTGEETAGFQREQNVARLKSLSDFYSDKENIIQNPLLCATRNTELCKIKFTPKKEDSCELNEYGNLEIEIPDYDCMPLVELLGYVGNYIKSRIPELTGVSPRSDLLATLKAKAAESGHINTFDGENNQEIDEGVETNEEDPQEATAALFEESHIIDFWNELACREKILKDIGDSFNGDEFLGFTREALISYLKPVVLVDGQHRLGGALLAARAAMGTPDIQLEIEDRIINGEEPDALEKELINRLARPLPVSLLMADSPGEQVFQFVIVNQKATPVGKALLGTIVSTSLSNEEMEKVADRLKSAGIELIESQAITYLARLPDSPFYNLVERGLTGDSNDLIKWNVFSSLISIFRDLKGGKLFGQKNDYSDIWRHRYLDNSLIVSKYGSEGHDTAYSYWNSPDGPWRDVFIVFWKEIRDRFGNTSDRDKHNYWGRPRESNLFNKVSLTIIAADFFQFLTDTKTSLDNVAEIPKLMDSWLEFVNKGYFDKDWDLSGVKKDSTGIRNQWAALWSEYRKGGGSLPDKRLYRKPKNE